MSHTLFTIRPVRSAIDPEVAVLLFKAYISSLGIDLSFQDVASELAAMPGKYAPPTRELLLAGDMSDTPLGCVGLQPMASDSCCKRRACGTQGARPMPGYAGDILRKARKP
jgi:hypothetical protein